MATDTDATSILAAITGVQPYIDGVPQTPARAWELVGITYVYDKVTKRATVTAGTPTIEDGSIDLVKLADVAAMRVLGSFAGGEVEELPATDSAEGSAVLVSNVDGELVINAVRIAGAAISGDGDDGLVFDAETLTYRTSGGATRWRTTRTVASGVRDMKSASTWIDLATFTVDASSAQYVWIRAVAFTKRTTEGTIIRAAHGATFEGTAVRRPSSIVGSASTVGVDMLPTDGFTEWVLDPEGSPIKLQMVPPGVADGTWKLQLLAPDESGTLTSAADLYVRAEVQILEVAGA